jgi:hypothetical protein
MYQKTLSFCSDVSELHFNATSTRITIEVPHAMNLFPCEMQIVWCDFCSCANNLARRSTAFAGKGGNYTLF